jgi:hypothetical protein
MNFKDLSSAEINFLKAFKKIKNLAPLKEKLSYARKQLDLAYELNQKIEAIDCMPSFDPQASLEDMAILKQEFEDSLSNFSQKEPSDGSLSTVSSPCSPSLQDHCIQDRIAQAQHIWEASEDCFLDLKDLSLKNLSK